MAQIQAWRHLKSPFEGGFRGMLCLIRVLPRVHIPLNPPSKGDSKHALITALVEQRPADASAFHGITGRVRRKAGISVQLPRAGTA